MVPREAVALKLLQKCFKEACDEGCLGWVWDLVTALRGYDLGEYKEEVTCVIRGAVLGEEVLESPKFNVTRCLFVKSPTESAEREAARIINKLSTESYAFTPLSHWLTHVFAAVGVLRRAGTWPRRFSKLEEDKS